LTTHDDAPWSDFYVDSIIDQVVMGNPKVLPSESLSSHWTEADLPVYIGPRYSTDMAAAGRVMVRVGITLAMATVGGVAGWVATRDVFVSLEPGDVRPDGFVMTVGQDWGEDPCDPIPVWWAQDPARAVCKCALDYAKNLPPGSGAK
jgi:hypothetical protein